MANIGATTAFYKVETSLTKANQEVSKSMERLATGKANANAGDRSSYVAMSDTFRLDYVGTKAGIKGASVVMGYLETGMRVLDSASSLLSRLQELAVLGSNATNTDADHEAINLEAEALGDEFNRLMSSATYKGKPVFVAAAGSEYVSLGGRDAEMTFGIGTIDYSRLYSSTARTITGGPNDGASINLKHLPSDAVAAKKYGFSPSTGIGGNAATLDADKTYVVTSLDKSGDGNAVAATEITYNTSGESANDILTDTSAVYRYDNTNGTAITTGDMALGDVLVTNAAVAASDIDDDMEFKQVTTDNPFIAGETYEIVSLGNSNGSVTTTGKDDASAIGRAAGIGTSTLQEGQQFTVASNASVAQMAGINSLTEGMTFKRVSHTNVLTTDIEAIQALVNNRRVQAGSQYAALESAVQYTTDLTAQYELGYNTVNDVNFSMETAHLAKNQILQQAATAMLAQANQGQQGLLQLIQG